MPAKSTALAILDPDLRQAVLRLHGWEQRRRWYVLLLLWLIVVPICLLLLRYPLSLLVDYFTWSGLRYGLAFNPKPASGLLVTLLLTVTSLLSRWFYHVFGLSGAEIRRLEKRVLRIRARGKQDPLWHKVWG